LKKIPLTRYVQRRKRWRKISLEESKETLIHPNERENLPEGKINASKSIGAKLIRVIYLEEKTRIVVISVIDKNR